MDKEVRSFFKVAAIIVSIIAVSIVAIALAVPKYRVYSQEHSGEAALRYANLQRQALVAQAQSERDAAELRSEAIEIIGAMTQQYPEYRQQEFIGAFATCLENGCAQQIIYVPTEGMIPITEAGKRSQ